MRHPLPLVLLLAACTDPAGGGPSTPGDTGETGDPPGDPPDGDCRRASDCDDDEICLLSGACDTPWGRTFAVGIDAAFLPFTKPSGAGWDPLGGDPDPYWTLFVDGVEVGRSPERSNTRDATWDERFRVTIRENTTVRFVVSDEDATFDDEVAAFTYDPPSLEVLRDGSDGVNENDADFRVAFEIVE